MLHAALTAVAVAENDMSMVDVPGSTVVRKRSAIS
jgi:hypothetical protein